MEVLLLIRPAFMLSADKVLLIGDKRVETKNRVSPFVSNPFTSSTSQLPFVSCLMSFPLVSYRYKWFHPSRLLCQMNCAGLFFTNNTGTSGSTYLSSVSSNNVLIKSPVAASYLFNHI